MQLSLTDLLANAGFALVALSFLVRDILMLRVVSIAASIAGIAYGFVGIHPLWATIVWNALFLAVNLTQVLLILREARGIKFTDEERDSLVTTFKGLSPLEFARLLRVGTWKNFDVGHVFLQQDGPSDWLYYLYEGKARVRIDADDIATLRDGAFIGEMGYVSGKNASATVRAHAPCRVLAWEQPRLREHLRGHPTTKLAFDSVLTADLAFKLGRGTRAYAEAVTNPRIHYLTLDEPTETGSGPKREARAG